jgi:hypothetical protein
MPTKDDVDLEVASVRPEVDSVGAHAQTLERSAQPPQVEPRWSGPEVSASLPSRRILVQPEQRCGGRLCADRPRGRIPISARRKRPRPDGKRERGLHQSSHRVSPQRPALGHPDGDAVHDLPLRVAALAWTGRRGGRGVPRRAEACRGRTPKQHHHGDTDRDPACLIHIGPTLINRFGVPRWPNRYAATHKGPSAPTSPVPPRTARTAPARHLARLKPRRDTWLPARGRQVPLGLAARSASVIPWNVSGFRGAGGVTEPPAHKPRPTTSPLPPRVVRPT